MIICSLRARLLYKFLMKKRALHLFVEELIKQRKDSQVVTEYKNNKLNVIQFLSCYDEITFLFWHTTPQGHDFWDKLNDEFYEFYIRSVLYKY